MEFKKGVIRPIACFKEGWLLIKDQYPLFFVFNVLAMLIAATVPFGIALGAMFCGIYYLLLQKINGKPFDVNDLLKGFRFFLPSLVVTAFVILPSLVFGWLTITAAVALIFTILNTKVAAPSESLIWGMFGTFAFLSLAFTIVAGTLHAFVMFAYPLIVDRELTGWQAFKLSARAVLANANGVIGLIIGEFILSLIGLMFFGVGIYLVIPLMFAAVIVAYKQVFSVTEAVSGNNSSPASPAFVNESQYR